MAIVTYSNPDFGFGVTYDDTSIVHTHDTADPRLRAAWSLRVPTQVAAAVLFTTRDATIESIARGLAPSLLLTTDAFPLQPDRLGRWDWEIEAEYRGRRFLEVTRAPALEAVGLYWRAYPVLQLTTVPPADADPPAPVECLSLLHTPQQTFAIELVVPVSDLDEWSESVPGGRRRLLPAADRTRGLHAYGAPARLVGPHRGHRPRGRPHGRSGAALTECHRGAGSAPIPAGGDAEGARNWPVGRSVVRAIRPARARPPPRAGASTPCRPCARRRRPTPAARRCARDSRIARGSDRPRRRVLAAVGQHEREAVADAGGAQLHAAAEVVPGPVDVGDLVDTDVEDHLVGRGEAEAAGRKVQPAGRRPEHPDQHPGIRGEIRLRLVRPRAACRALAHARRSLRTAGTPSPPPASCTCSPPSRW